MGPLYKPSQSLSKKPFSRQLFECTCPFLNRKLPFRRTFLAMVATDITRFFPNKSTLLTIVFDNAGGLLREWLLIKALKKNGFNTLQFILIEPQQNHPQITQAIAAFQKLVSSQACWLFNDWDSYGAACIKNKELKGDCVISIDPDPQKRFIDLSTKKSRLTWLTYAQQTLAPFSYQATLFFHELHKQPHRHSIRLVLKQKSATAPSFVPLTALIHQWGEIKFTNKAPYLFIGAKAMLPPQKKGRHPLLEKVQHPSQLFQERLFFQRLVRFLHQEKHLQLPRL